MLTPQVVEGFVGSILASKFDDPVKTPDFHKEGWKLFCSNNKMVALAAPRGHAKLKSWVFSDEFAMWSLIFILLNISLYIAIIVALYVAIVNIVYTDHDEHDTIDMEDLR